jgi:hypothetical protein
LAPSFREFHWWPRRPPPPAASSSSAEAEVARQDEEDERQAQIERAQLRKLNAHVRPRAPAPACAR